MRSLAQYTNEGYDLSLEGFKKNVVDTGGAFATAIALTAQQSGRTLLVDDAAGLSFTLPAIATAQIGTYFKFIVVTTITSNSFKVTAASGDLLTGGLWCIDYNAAVDAATREAIWFSPDVSDDLIIDMNGTTTGGVIGTHVEVTAVSATRWFVEGTAVGDGTLVTPFS